MRYSFILLSYLVLFVLACTPEQKESIAEESITENAFDSSLAAQYGADEYGMKKYVIAFLYTGEKREKDSVKAAELQAAHMANIHKMADSGKLVLAGPFFKGDLRGLYLFDVASIAEADSLTNTDPAIISGHLRMELKEWYASAGLMAVSELHDKVAKVKF